MKKFTYDAGEIGSLFWKRHVRSGTARYGASGKLIRKDEP